MRLQDHLKNIPHLPLISSLARKRKINVWLVGGFLRDIYLNINYGLPVRSTQTGCLFHKGSEMDFDFCVERNVADFVKEFAAKIFSKYIVLDEKQGSFRVILKRRDVIHTYDFTLIRGNDFWEDLSLRDFSINTLAVNLLDKRKRIIDDFSALLDIKRKLIRIIKDEVLLDDPLRILRGFSFMATLGFSIEKKTEKAMIKYKGFLKNVSQERINEELFKILSAQYSYRVIKRMSELRILDEIIPYVQQCRFVIQGAYHHLPVWEHCLETLRKWELFYNNKLKKNKDIYDYLNEELSYKRRRIYIVKLACLLHDIGKPQAKKEKNKKTIFYGHEKIGRDLAEEIGEYLRLSFREKEVLKRLIFWHLRPGYLSEQYSVSKRAVYRFFRDTQEEGVSVIVLSVADWRATRGPLIDIKKRRKQELVMLKLINNYFQEKEKKPFSRIVDGYDIMRHFNLSPSPLIGEILKTIQEKQALGVISKKQEAYKTAKQIVEKRKTLEKKIAMKKIREIKSKLSEINHIVKHFDK